MVRFRIELVSCLAALAMHVPLRAADSGLSDWFEPVEPVHIAGPIYYVGTRELGAYLITTPEGHVLIDGAMPTSAASIEASIEKLGFHPKDIRILLITHAHIDHVGTLAHFKKLTGASVQVVAPEDALLASGGTTDYLYATDPQLRFDPVKADRVLTDGAIVEIGGIALEAHHTPGHTRGCTTWTTTIGDAGRPYTVVFTGSTSINPGTQLGGEHPSYPGIADDYARSLATLEALTPDIFLAPHASFFGFAEKRERAAAEGVAAFVDPEGFRNAIAASKRAFEEARTPLKTLP